MPDLTRRRAALSVTVAGGSDNLLSLAGLRRMFNLPVAPLGQQTAGDFQVLAEGAVGQVVGESGQGVGQPRADGRGGQRFGGEPGQADRADRGDQFAGEDFAERVQEL